MIAANTYRLPVPKDSLKRMTGPHIPAHRGKLRHAIDFIVPEGTAVVAAANGTVTFVKDDSNIGGPDPDLLGLYQFYCNHAPKWGIYKIRSPGIRELKGECRSNSFCRTRDSQCRDHGFYIYTPSSLSGFHLYRK